MLLAEKENAANFKDFQNKQEKNRPIVGLTAVFLRKIIKKRDFSEKIQKKYCNLYICLL